MSVRLPSLTSLRWFAASSVFLLHGRPLMAGSAGEDAYRTISGGSVGVSFFFILSGFVLAWTHQSGDSSRAFYRRRVARIIPAYLAAWVLGIAFIVVVDHAHAVEVGKALFAGTLLQAWVPASSMYYAGNSVAWSLSVEVFFYALFPLMIPVIARLNVVQLKILGASAMLIAVALPLLLRPTGPGPVSWAVYINPAYRLMEFVVGLCLASLLRRGTRAKVPPWTAATLVLAAYLIAPQTPRYASAVVITIVPFALLIFACAESDLQGRASVLWHPWLIRLGEWSFAFYLLHELVTRLVAGIADTYSSTLWHVALVLWSYLTATGAAFLLYRYLEYPLERRIRGGGRRLGAEGTMESSECPCVQTERCA